MQRRVAVGVGVVCSVVFGLLMGWATQQNDVTRNPARRARPAAQRPAARTGPLEHAREVADRSDAPAGAPNVVLVFGCTVRRDQVSPYGAPPEVTPFLDQLAGAGARFTDALSVSSWTRDSAVGALTGLHPLSLGLPDPAPKQTERALPDEATTLAERLADAGWMTFGLTANPNLNAVYGMAQGMDRYRDSNDKAFRAARVSGAEGVSQALAMLDARTEDERDRPFYLQLMLIDAHHPRTPPAERLKVFRAEGVSEELAVYRASLRELDAALEQLDRGLRSRGYADDTLFVFLTDHGEGLDLPPHHGPGHGKKMYPTTVAIPWIVRGPGVPAGGRIDGLASGVDVTPTVLGLLGLEVEEGLAGRDWSAWVRGSRADRLPRERAYSASMFHVADVAAIWTRDRQCQEHFEHDRDREVTGCFDRRADPDFTRPIADPALRAELIAWRQDRLAEAEAFGVEQAEVGPDVAEQLEVLGYLSE